MPADATDQSTVAATKVRAVQEPGYANVWSIVDDATGIVVADMRVSCQAGPWAKRIADALNAQLQD